MEINFVIVALAALIPLIMGFIWYNPKTFGPAWMTAAGTTREQGRSMNMVKVFGLTYVMSFLMTFILMHIVIHQFGLFSLLMDSSGPGGHIEGSEKLFTDTMAVYGDHFRTFKHGTLH